MTQVTVKNNEAQRTAFRNTIFTAEKIIGDCPQVEAPVTHHFCDGCYAREMLLKKDTLVIGKIHRHSHVNVLSKGKVTVSSEFHTETFEAPRTWISEPGIKRMIFAHKDTIWTTLHVTKSTDLEEIEKEVIADSYSELLENKL